MVLSYFLHLGLHHFILVNQLIIWYCTICFLIISSTVLLILFDNLGCCNFLLISLILRYAFIWINRRFVSFCLIVSKSSLKWIKILTYNVLIIMIICCILWRHTTLRFMVAAFRDYRCVLTQNMCWRNLMLSLVVLVEILR